MGSPITPASPSESPESLEEFDGLRSQRMGASDDFDEEEEEDDDGDQTLGGVAVSRARSRAARGGPSHYRLNARWRRCWPCCRRLVRSIPRAQVRSLLELAWPSALSLLAMQAVAMTSLAFVGHLGEAELGGAAAGNAVQNLLGFSVVVGLNSAVDTLCAQSFGAGQKQLVGLVAQRAAAAFTLVLIPIGVLWWHTEQLLLWAGQEADVARLAGEYVRWSMPSLLPYLYTDIARRFLQAQGITRPQILIALVANAWHAIVAWTCVFRLGLGLKGAAMAYASTHFVTLALTLGYVRWGNGSRLYRSMCPPALAGGGGASGLLCCFSDLSTTIRRLCTGWGELYSLGLPGVLMLFGEWCVYELIQLASGWVGRTELDTFSLLQTVTVSAFMLPLSISIAASILVGNALGAAQPRQASLVARGAVMLALLFVCIELLVLMLLRGRALGALFTTDEPVLSLFTDLSQWYLLWLLPFDALQCTQGGVIRGAGFQKMGAATNMVAYWLVGVPLALGLAFRGPKLGLPGLLIGMACAVTIAAIAFAVQLRRVDWDAESRRALQRVEEERQAGLAEAAGGAAGSDGAGGGGTRFDASSSAVTDEGDEEDDEDVLGIEMAASPTSGTVDSSDAGAESFSSLRNGRGEGGAMQQASAHVDEDENEDVLAFAANGGGEDGLVGVSRADIVLASASPPVPPPVLLPPRDSQAAFKHAQARNTHTNH